MFSSPSALSLRLPYPCRRTVIGIFAETAYKNSRYASAYGLEYFRCALQPPKLARDISAAAFQQTPVRFSHGTTDETGTDKPSANPLFSPLSTVFQGKPPPGEGSAAYTSPSPKYRLTRAPQPNIIAMSGNEVRKNGYDSFCIYRRTQQYYSHIHTENPKRNASGFYFIRFSF